MQITVFGAGGATGRLIVAEALERGHAVTAFVRTPGKLALQHERLTIVQGDATDPRAVAAAVASADVVVSAIGGTGLGPSTQITDCTSTIVAACTEQRFVSVSTVGAGGSGRLMPLAARPILLMLRNAIKDHDGAEAAIMDSNLRWTIARCVGLTDHPARGHASASRDRVGGSRIPRADVAAWIVDQFESETYLRQAVALW
jgi:putative NADH-flavin reductase